MCVCVCVCVCVANSTLSLFSFIQSCYFEYKQNITVKHSTLIISTFVYQLMHKRTALKGVLKFTLKQLQHVSV